MKIHGSAADTVPKCPATMMERLGVTLDGVVECGGGNKKTAAVSTE